MAMGHFKCIKYWYGLDCFLKIFILLKSVQFEFGLPPSTAWDDLSNDTSSSSWTKLMLFKTGRGIFGGTCFEASIAELYNTMPNMAINMPITFLNVNEESKSIHPSNKTQTVFMWPNTWKDTAENRPMHIYWLKLQNTARAHERLMKNCTQNRDLGERIPWLS